MTNQVLLPQADKVEKVINYVAFLSNKPKGLTIEEIANKMDLPNVRDAHYYLMAAKQVGLVKFDEETLRYSVVDKKIAKNEEKITEFMVKFIQSMPLCDKFIDAHHREGRELSVKELVALVPKNKKWSSTTVKRRMTTIRSWSKWAIENSKEEHYQLDLLMMI